jgi:hypothetical protein
MNFQMPFADDHFYSDRKRPVKKFTKHHYRISVSRIAQNLVLLQLLSNI